MSQEKNYGSWSSPIAPNLLQSNSVTYQYLCRDEDNKNSSSIIYWIELNSNGKNIIKSRDINCPETVIWTPEGFSARTRVHEYGGADCFVYSGVVYFSNDSDQNLYKQNQPQVQPIRVNKEECCRYANGYYCASLGSIFIVREDHRDKANVVNTVVTIRDNAEKIIVAGADFYSSPRVSDDGKHVCWVQWDHPNMPWDNTRICLAMIDSKELAIVPGTLKNVVTGSDQCPISNSLPMFAADNNLLYVSDQSGYWNLWACKIENVSDKLNLTPVEEDLGDPMWRFDTRRYSYQLKRNEFVVARKDGRLEFLKPANSDRNVVDYGQHLSSISQCQLMPDGSVVAFGSSGTTKKTIYRFWENGHLAVLGQNPVFESVDERYFSVPRHIKFPVSGTFSHGYYYAPCNPDYHAPKGQMPPLLVQAHGGPTANTTTELKMAIQYWTSRGYAFLDVDYRGSTSYGKEYRELLKGKWGILDMEDCVAGVEYLIDNRMVDKDKVFIRGGSAGGYTTLCCLTFTSTFKAGSSCYGIGDLKMLLEDTHKFESRYLDIIIGDAVKEANLYHERSPLNFPEKISCPVIFFQGEEDRIVPMEQSVTMFNAVKAKGVPCCLKLYPGEQHGFRKIENVIDNIESEYYFFAQLFGFDTPDIRSPSITIENFGR